MIRLDAWNVRFNNKKVSSMQYPKLWKGKETEMQCFFWRLLDT